MSIFGKIASFPLIRLLVAVLAGFFLVLQGYQLAEIQNNSQLLGLPIFGAEFKVPWLLCLLFDILCIGIAMLVIGRINSMHRLIEGSMFSLYAFLFIGLTTWSKFLLYPEILFASLLGLIVLSLLLQIYKQGNILGYVFAASILGSLAILFYSPSLVLMPLIFIGFSVFRPFDLRSFFFGLIGFGLVFVYLFTVAYVFNWQFNWYPIEQWTTIKSPDFNLFWQQIPSLLFIAIGLLASWRMYGLRQKLIVRQRNQLSVVFAFLAFYSMLSMFYGISKSLLMVLVPLSIAFLFYYQNVKRKWIIEVVLLLILCFNTWLSFFN